MVRKVKEADRELYLTLVKEFYSSEAVLHPIPAEYMTATFEEMMRSGDYVRGYLLSAGEETAGYALISLTFSQEAGGRVAWIEEIYIRPAFRGRGLGKEFFTYMEEHVESKVKRMRLELEPDNRQAKKLYEALGYEDLGYAQMVKETK